MATHSSILPWRIPWTEELGGLQSMGFHRVGHDWVTDHTHAYYFHFIDEILRLRKSECAWGLRANMWYKRDLNPALCGSTPLGCVLSAILRWCYAQPILHRGWMCRLPESVAACRGCSRLLEKVSWFWLMFIKNVWDLKSWVCPGILSPSLPDTPWGLQGFLSAMLKVSTMWTCILKWIELNGRMSSPA